MDPLTDGHPGLSRGQVFYDTGDSRLRGWIREAIDEGERINKSDPSFARMDTCISYLMGEQLQGRRPKYVPAVVINEVKKTIREHIATLTDIRPLFAFRSQNPQFEQQGNLLNKNTVVWWVNTFADLDLADVVAQSATTGTGDCVVEFDPAFGPLGDTRLLPRDARDTLPIRPSRTRSLQDWEGVIIKEAHSPNKLASMYPEKVGMLGGNSRGMIGQIYTRFKRLVKTTEDLTIFERLKSGHDLGAVMPEIPLYRIYLNDRSINGGDSDRLMGTVGTPWCYLVKPGERLYPRKRLILSTDTTVLYDGPSPYWHGMYPISRLKLDPWPWAFFGLSLVHDLMPLQDAINMVANDFLTVFSQWANRGAIADKNAVPESLLENFDPRRPNWKLKLNPTYGDGFKMVDGPQLPPWSMEFFQGMFAKFEDHAGTANLQQLLNLRQMPSGDTIERFWQAMTPEMRREGRMIEAFLRDVAEMIKGNQFQYYSTKRRMMVSGSSAVTVEDYDLDPDNMVPAMQPGQDGYVPQLDASKPRDERAQYFQSIFAFTVAPNSMLATNAMERKMLYLQLSRMGYIDVWSLLEMLEIPNVGAPPPIPVPAGPPPMDPATGQPMVDPMTGQPMPPPMMMKPAETITERLQAQQLMGIGMTESPAGRKASGQKPPHLERKSDGQGGERVTMAES